MEITFDPDNGAFESRNGQPIDGEVPTQEPLSYEQESTPYVEQEEPEELKPFNFNSYQKYAVDTLKQELDVDVEQALRWANTPDCEITDGGHERLVEMMKSDDPETVKIGMGLISLAQTEPDLFNHTDEITENFSDSQQNDLVDLLGGSFASQIVNHTYQLTTGQITKADVIKQVASNPELRDAYLDAAKAGLLTINL